MPDSENDYGGPVAITSSPGAGPSSVNKLGQSIGAKGVDRRQAVIDNLIKRLGEKAPWDITVADIMHGTGTTKASFYTYFSSVHEVMLAAAWQALDDVPDFSPEFNAGWDQLSGPVYARSVLLKNIEFWNKHKVILEVMQLMADRRVPEAVLVRREWASAAHRQITRRFEAAKAAGNHTPAFNCAAAGHNVLLFITYFSSHYHNFLGLYSAENLLGTAAELLTRLICNPEKIGSDQGWLAD